MKKEFVRIVKEMDILESKKRLNNALCVTRKVKLMRALLLGMIVCFTVACSQTKKTDGSNPVKWVIRGVTNVWNK
jgi:hypothetical protein|tara:strand:- start:280 stop:504 length:225 start_codon:yes stop_codon:yes gene_type:complete